MNATIQYFFYEEKNIINTKQTKLLNLLKNIHNNKNHHNKNSFNQLIPKISKALFETLKTQDIHSIITLKKKINNNKNINNEIKEKLITEIDQKINKIINDLISNTLSDNIKELEALYKEVEKILKNNINNKNNLIKFKTSIITKINTLLISKSNLNNLNLEQLKKIENELRFIKFNNLHNVKNKIKNLFRNIKIKKDQIYKKNLNDILKIILGTQKLITNGKNNSSALTTTTTSSALTTTTTSSALTPTSSALTTNLKLDENNIKYIIIYLNTLDKNNDLQKLILNKSKEKYFGKTRFGMNEFAQYQSLDSDYKKFIKNYFDNLELTKMELNNNLSRENALTILGLNNKATNADIKKQYKQLALEYHPNRLRQKGKTNNEIKKATEKFKNVASAYETLNI